MAPRAASTARFSPAARPVPTAAAPPLCRAARTSAKSRFRRPWTATRLTISPTVRHSVSSMVRKASSMVASAGICSRTRSLGTVATASTFPASVASARSASCRRRTPSNPNGVVTTAMVSAPFCRAISAITGAAPEPVPPPRPVVMTTKSDPVNARPIWSVASRAATSPAPASPPVPRPLVICLPTAILVRAETDIEELPVRIIVVGAEGGLPLDRSRGNSAASQGRTAQSFRVRVLSWAVRAGTETEVARTNRAGRMARPSRS